MIQSRDPHRQTFFAARFLKGVPVQCMLDMSTLASLISN